MRCPVSHQGDDEQRSRRAAIPCRPAGCGGMGPAAALPLRDDAPTSPVSHLLASGPMALATRPSRLLPRAARRQDCA